MQQAMLGGAVIAANVVSFSPHNERALFGVGKAPPPTAFAAVAPPAADDVVLPIDAPAVESAPVEIRQADAVPAPPSPERARGEIPAISSDDGNPGLSLGHGSGAVTEGEATSLAETVQTPGLQPSQLAGSGTATFGPANVPVAATGGSPGAPGNPAAPGTPGAAGDPVGPVPEPATWITMVTGFLALAVVLRRRVGG